MDEYLQNLCAQDRPKEEIIKMIVRYLRRVHPDYNVMIVHSAHMQSFKKCQHFHIDIPVPQTARSTYGYEVYVFKRGHFILFGNTDRENLCYSGKCRRYGNNGFQLIFSKP